MEAGASEFPANVTKALADSAAQWAMTETGRASSPSAPRPARQAAGIRCACVISSRDIKDHVLDHLDLYLERYEEKVTESGGHVHWAATAEDARAGHHRHLQARSARRSSPRASR